MEYAIQPVAAPSELNLFAAMWRYRFLVLTTVILVVGAAVLYGVSRPRSYVAEASLILQSPSSSSNLGAPEAARYVTDQLTILRSRAVNTSALAATRKALPDAGVSEDDIRGVTLLSSDASDVVVIRFSAGSATLAETAANAIGKSYQGALQAQLAANAAASAKFNANKISTINTRLGEISAQLGELSSDPANDARITSLTQEQSGLLGQRATLYQQRGALSAASQSPAAPAIFIPVDRPVEQGNSGLLRLAVVATFLGLLLGAAIAYALAIRKRTFANPSEVEVVVGAPMLGEVPDFSGARRRGGSQLPRMDTAAGEAFRMLALAVSSRAEIAEARTVVVVSATPGEGKTVITASVAIAAATDGARILVVDADPRSRALSQLIETVELERTPIDSPPTSREGATLGPGVPEVKPWRVFTQTATFDLVLMGSALSSNAWRSDVIGRYFHDVRANYDLVLIDSPGVLSWSDAATLAVHADAAVIVVPKHSSVADVTGVVSILRLVGTGPLGYVHNLASAARRNRGNTSSAGSAGAGRRGVVARHQPAK